MFLKRNGKRSSLWTACYLTVVFAFFLMPYMVSASSSYPSDQTVTDQGMVFTKSATWKDQTHAGGNYGAEISLKVENAEPAGRVPVDVAVILCSSPGLNNPTCTHPSHKTLEEDSSQGVKEILDNAWDSSYLLQLPDPTDFTDSNIKDQNAAEFVVEVKVGGVSGYLCPVSIYTQENGTDYIDNFKKRTNWGFVTQNPVSSSKRLTLHMGENGEIVGQASANGTRNNGIYTLNVSGKSGAAANCTSGAAIATLSAKNFVDTVLHNHSSNNIALIPYGYYTSYPDPVFTSERDMLYSQIEEAYEQSRPYRTSKEAFQSAKDALDKQTSGRPKAVVFLTDYNIRNDQSRDEAIGKAGEMRAQGIPVYVMGYDVTDANIQQYLKPFAFDYDKDHPEADCEYLIDINRSDYGLKEGFETIAQRISGQEISLIFTDYISEYFQVDRTQLPSDFQVQEEVVTDGASSKTLEKVTVVVKTSDVTQNNMSIKIPVILKEPYRNSSDYLNTNYIFQSENRKSAEACFWDSTGTYRNIGGGVDSPYLQPVMSVTPAPDPVIKTAKLTFDLQGGNPPQGQKLEPVTVTVGTKISEVPGYSLIPLRDNYVFGGWFKESECVNPVGNTLMPERDTTIYARWIQSEASLIYSADGGVLEEGSSLQPELVTIGSPIADANGYKQNLKREGYQFAGWYMDSSLNIPVGTNTMPDQTTTIYAKWTPVEKEDPKKDPEDPKKDPENPKKDPEDSKKDPENPKKDPEDLKKDLEATKKPEKKDSTLNLTKNPLVTPSQGKNTEKEAVNTGDLTRGTLLYLLLCGASVILTAVVGTVVVRKKKH